MAILVDKNTKVICQSPPPFAAGSILDVIAADDLSDAAQKIVKAVKG